MSRRTRATRVGSQSRSRQLSLLVCEGNPFDRVWPPTNSVTYNPSSLRLTPSPPPHFACKFSKLTDRGAGGVEEHRADSVATRTRDPHEPAGPASRHANSSCTTHQEQGYYVCGLELRSLNLIYIVSRAMAHPHDLSDHGFPIWIGVTTTKKCLRNCDQRERVDGQFHLQSRFRYTEERNLEQENLRSLQS